MSEFLVVGPPGTGKTSFIRSEVERLVYDEGYDPEDFILTSYTRTAAAVLRGRIDVPFENTATLHSLARKALGKPQIAEVGDLVKQWNEQADIPASWKINIARSESLVEEEGTLPNPEEVLASRFDIYNLARARLLPPEHPTMKTCAEFASRWEAFKSDTWSMDFADLISHAADNSDHCPGDPPILVVDEAQDFVPAQWRLIDHWGTAENIDRFYIAGDPAQTLYAFAGATPEQMMIDVPEGQARQLGQSWRLPQSVMLRAEEYLRSHSGTIFDHRTYHARPNDEEQPDDPVVGAVRQMPINWQDPDEIMNEINGQVREGRNVMLLASCGYMLDRSIVALRDAGIRYHNPYRLAAGQWNPVGQHSVARDALTAFLRPGVADREGSQNIRNFYWTLSDALSILGALKATGPFFKRGVKTRALESNLSNYPADEHLDDGTPLYTPFGLHNEDGEPLFSQEMWAAVMEGDTAWWLKHVNKPLQKTSDYLVRTYRKSGFDALTDDPQVVIGTIHSVKGGEADVVYLMPEISPAMYHDSERSPSGKDSMIRLGYVGMTRAREELVICPSTMEHRTRTFGFA